MKENQTIKVSVIIPIYNVEKYIEECLLSILEQSLRDIEIICVNDGSSDKTMDIVEKYAKLDSRIVIINQENGGPSSARNAGLFKARGEYISFIDSDDRLTKVALEELYDYVFEYKLDNIYFDAETYYQTDNLEKNKKDFYDYYKRKANYDGVYDGQNLFAEMITNNDFKPSVCLQMTRREMILSNNIKFYNGIIHEDNLYTISIFMVEERAMHVKKNYYMRRVREDSIMTTEEGIKNAWGYFISCKELYSIMSQINLTEEFYYALKSYINKMQNKAMSVVRNMSDEEIVVGLNSLNATTGDKTQFMLNIYERAKERKRVSSSGYNKPIKNKNKNIINKIDKKVTNKFILKIIQIIILLRHKGIRYLLYRLKLKFSKETYVSIIIPIYNAQDYLEECLDSLLLQKLRNIEIICVNDGSTDNTANILKKYADKDKRITIIEQDNLGAATARNKGIEMARGEYLLFLDADDKFDTDLCNAAYYRSHIANADICLFGAKRYDISSSKIEPMTWVLRYKDLPSKLVFSTDDISEKIFQVTSACPWSKMLKRQFVLENDLKFQNLKNSNDVLFIRSACAIAKRITAINQQLVTYRWNTETSTQSTKDLYPTEFYKAFKELKKQLIEKDVFDKVQRSYVNMVLTESLHHLKTVKSIEAKQKIIELLINEAFDYYDLESYDEAYFYNINNYDAYKSLVNCNPM